MKGLLRLNALMETAPTADPEDLGDWDGTAAANRSSKKQMRSEVRYVNSLGEDDDESDDSEAGGGGGGKGYAPSRLRADAAMDASEWGDRYSAKKVSRKQLAASDDEEDVEDEDDDEDDSSSVSSEDLEEGDLSDDDDDDDDSSSNKNSGDDEDGDEDDEYGAAGQESVFAGVGRRDDVDAQLVALRREGSNGGGSSTPRALAAAAAVEDTVQARGAAARALVAAYDGLLEVRILQQQAVGLANKLPAGTVGASALGAARGGASAKLQRTLQLLCSWREDLRLGRAAREAAAAAGAGAAGAEGKQQAAARAAAALRSGHPVDNGKRGGGGDGDADGDGDEEGTGDVLLGDPADLADASQPPVAGMLTRGRKRRLEEAWAGVAAGFDRAKPFWEET